MENTLYYGDNLEILREHIPNESIDLIYLDPPFNSKRSYNVLFSTPKGHQSEAQITAFEDSWTWGEQAEREYTELIHQANINVAEVIQSLRRVLKNSSISNSWAIPFQKITEVVYEKVYIVHQFDYPSCIMSSKSNPTTHCYD